MTVGKPYKKSNDAIDRLSLLQFEVTQNNATEPRFRNEYWRHYDAGLYVDVVSGEPLFQSTHKFASSSGWPSFGRPVAPGAVTEHADDSHGMKRIEVRSVHGDSHLGHAFRDGPEADGGMRYCINSAALRFIPAQDLHKAGYARFAARLAQAETGGQNEH